MYAIITIVPYAADYKVKTNPNYYLYYIFVIIDFTASYP